MKYYSGDDIGFIQDDNETIIRFAYENYKDIPGKIYNLYEKYKLSSYGIVPTQFDAVINQLRHEKFLITYPHEWPPNMFKDAVLFHLDLLVHLHRYGITLKDGLPENILFDGIRPVFIDFFSILPEVALSKESWLANGCPSGIDLRLHALRLMFVPYMLIPLLCYAFGDFALGRKQLAEKFCNNASRKIPSWADLPKTRGFRHYLNKLKNPSLLSSQLQAIKDICMNPDIPWLYRISRLRGLVEGLEVNPPVSGGYITYYEDKKENWGHGDSSLWQEKQQGVQRVFCDSKPKTVLDLGANTGWFSLLACNMGASVIAIDNDVACVDLLYRTAVFCRLPLTPLCLSFDDLSEEHFAGGGQSAQPPIHAAALKRLKADCVLCLGLLHHLTLGMGKSFTEIFEKLDALTLSTLVLEFVEWEDKLIQGEQGFFPNLSRWNKETYNLETVKHVAARFFKHCSQLPSTPAESRILLVLKR
jgi:hypothetical protein